MGNGFRQRIVRASWFILVFCGASRGYAFPGLDDRTLGTDQVRTKSHVGLVAEGGAGYFDGKIETSPADVVHTDKRLENFVRLGWDGQHTNGGFRLRVETAGELRAEEDDTDPKVYIDQRTFAARATADGTFRLQNSYEAFAGMMGSLFPGYRRTTSTINGKSKRNYDTTAMANPRLGMAKMGGDWGAGLYYIVGTERSRGYDEDVFDGSTASGSEVVAVPSRLGLFGAGPVGPLKAEGEFAIVQGSKGGPQDNNGHSVSSDNFAMQASGDFPMLSGTRGKLGIFHQTASYNDGAFMTLDNIAGTAFRFETYLQEGSFKGTAGVVLGFGHDDQSLPEITASYSYRSFGVVGTMQVAF